MYYHFPFPHHQTPNHHGCDDLGWSSSFPNYSRTLVLVQSVLRQGMYYHFTFPHHQIPTHHGRDDLGLSSSLPSYSRRFPPLTPHRQSFPTSFTQFHRYSATGTPTSACTRKSANAPSAFPATHPHTTLTTSWFGRRSGSDIPNLLPVIDRNDSVLY